MELGDARLEAGVAWRTGGGGSEQRPRQGSSVAVARWCRWRAAAREEVGCGSDGRAGEGGGGAGQELAAAAAGRGSRWRRGMGGGLELQAGRDGGWRGGRERGLLLAHPDT